MQSTILNSSAIDMHFEFIVDILYLFLYYADLRKYPKKIGDKICMTYYIQYIPSSPMPLHT